MESLHQWQTHTHTHAHTPYTSHAHTNHLKCKTLAQFTEHASLPSNARRICYCD